MRILSLETYTLLVRNKMKLVTFEKYCNNIIVTIHCSLVCAQDGSLMQGLLTIFFFFHGTALWNVMILQKMNGSL